MMHNGLALALALMTTPGQAANRPADASQPLLRVEAEGPTAFVVAVAFSPDGKTLYATGFDKVVRTWLRDAAGRFTRLGPTYRVPVGPGHQGILNAMAVSPDGKWVAVGGRAVARELADFREPGRVLPRVGRMSDEALLDEGQIYLFPTGQGPTRVLRGHTGQVSALAFAPPAAGKPTVLVSAGRDQSKEQADGVGAVRAWDVDAGKLIAAYTKLPTLLRNGEVVRPGLAAWRSADGDVQAGIAWLDGTFRVWDVARPDTMWEFPGNGQLDGVVTLLPGKSTFVTGSYRVPGGSHLQAWALRDNQAPVADARRTVSFPPARVAKAVLLPPQGLVPLGQRDAADYLAAVARSRVPAGDRNQESFVLRIADLTGASWKPTSRDLPLWPFTGVEYPVLAASPDGKHLAVAGNRDHSVLVYAVSDLLDPAVADPKPQVLRAQATDVVKVAFVRRDNQQGPPQGLRLTEHVGNADREQIFDFARRELVKPSDAWKPDAPADAGWTVAPVLEQNRVAGIQVKQGARNAGKISLSKLQVVRAVRVRPPMGQMPALVAVGLDEAGEPILRLYNGETGEQVRQFTGHVFTLRDLAFSADGRLLASAAADRTVCVWSLTDLGETLGKLGFLAGVAVENGNNGVAVARIWEDHLAADNRGKVAVDDRIEEVAVGGQARSPKTSAEFYELIGRVVPGQSVRVKPAGKQAVDLRVGQGADERKPLLSLFLAADGKNWIGWSPLGRYDVSADAAERFLGWHFNTGNPAQPTRFAEAGEYRDRMRYRDLLSYLVENGKPPPPPKELPPPDARTTLWLDEVGPEPEKRDREGRFPVPEGKVTLVVRIDGLPASFIEPNSLVWRVGTQSGRLSKLPLDDRWSADLSGVRWKRGDNRVEVRFDARAAARPEYSEAITLRYQPPAPRLDPVGRQPAKDVEDAKYKVSVRVEPRSGGVPAVVRLVHLHEKVNLVPDMEARVVSKPTDLSWDLTLKPGVNVVKVVAENQNALPGYEDRERDWVSLGLVYKDPRPKITLQKIEIPGPEGKPVELPVEPDRTVVVNAAVATLVGMIGANEPLTEADWTGPGGVAKLEEFKAGSPKVDLRQTVKLDRPGVHEIRIRARTATSERGEVTVRIEYRPPLPSLTLRRPADATDLFWEENSPEVELEAAVRWPEEGRYPCEALVRVDGKPVGQPIAVGQDTEVVKARVPLGPGANAVQVVLRRGDSQATAAAVRVNYLRPPRVMNVTQTLQEGRPFLDVKADILSPAGLDRPTVELDNRVIGAEFLSEGATRDGVTEWHFTAKNLALQAGDNQLQLRARNSDGWTRKPAVIEVKGVVFNPPVVEMRSPDGPTSVQEKPFRVSFRVTSATPLQSVELLRNGKVIRKVDIDPANRIELSYAEEVTLDPGDNQFQVAAVNQGGRTIGPKDPPVVQYLSLPVRLELTGMESPARPGMLLRPTGERQTGLSFPEAPQGKMVLRGQIEWDPANDEVARNLTWLHIYANGMQLRPVPLQEAGPGERRKTFAAPVLLDKKKDNHLAVRLPEVQLLAAGQRWPELRSDAVRLTQCSVDCANPEPTPRRRLHVLIAGSSEEGGREQLVTRVLQALQAERTRGDEFKREGFADGGIIYGPVSGDNLLGKIRGQFLDHIRPVIEQRVRAGRVGDVVMVYFRGYEQVTPEGNLFFTNKERQGQFLRCEDFRMLFANNMGAQLLLLDVVRDTAPTTSSLPRDFINRWPTFPHVAVLRYTWSGTMPADLQSSQMLEDLGLALSHKHLLKEVTEELSRKFSTADAFPLSSLRFGQSLLYYMRRPSSLDDLRVGLPE